MDDRRFDRLARMVARRRSRRGVVRGLAGLAALVAAGRAAAPVAAESPGQPCTHDAQCVWDFGQEHVCADNGFDYDGPYNCCTFAGNRCASHEACCFDAVCLGGVCATQQVFAGSGDPCGYGQECRAADTALTCDYNATTEDYRCCAYEGGRCASDEGCCGGLRCNGGFCVSDAPPTTCTAYLCGCDPYYNRCDPGLGCCPSEIGYVCAPWCYGG